MSFGFGVGDFLAVLKIAQSVRGKWIDAPPEYASIKNEIKSVENILRDITELETQVELTPREIQTLHEILSSCVPVLETCNKIVDKYVAITEPGSKAGNRVKRTWKRFKLDPDDIRHARDQLNSLVGQLTAAEGAIQIRVTSDMQDAVDDLQQSDDQRERERIADWYAPCDFAVQQNEYSRTRQGGTGAWFLQDDHYIAWRIPGSGKTIMTAAIIDDLHRFLENRKDHVVAYFYCNFNRRDQQELHHIYSSLVRQLFQEQSSVPEKVSELHLKHRDRQTKPSTGELKDLLRLLVQRHRRVYFIIDALDECNVDNLTRDLLLYELFDIQKSSGNVSLLATTRFVPEIMQNFAACKQIEVRAAKEDIEQYLDNRMSELASFVSQRTDLRHEIKSQIVKLSDGMFLLTRLHFEALLGYTNITKLRQALHNLPSGKDALNRAYDTARERIDHQVKPQADLARQVLTWIVYAKRELSMEELQEAVAVSMTPGKTSINHDDDLDEPESILSVCAGLVVLDSQTGIVRLVHYTTKDYIDSVQHQWLPNARLDMAQCCMTYLCLDPFLLKEVRWRIYLGHYHRHYRLLYYIGEYWGVHLREIENDVAMDQVLQFMGDERKVCFASQVTEARRSGYDTCPVERISPFHICAHFDMTDTCNRLLETEKTYELKDSRGRTPLLWAVLRESPAILQLLLRQPDIDINIQDEDGWTPLLHAATYGNRDAVELLLRQPDINVNIQDDKWGETALARAAIRGYRDVVELLLRRPDIKVNKHEDEFGATALMWAASRGHKDVVELLLRQPDINVNIQNVFGWTALMEAAMRGHRDVVELLLRQPDIGVSIQDTDGQTALSFALDKGHEEIAALLRPLSTDTGDGKALPHR